jgi:hypothetical protein
MPLAGTMSPLRRQASSVLLRAESMSPDGMSDQLRYAAARLQRMRTFEKMIHSVTSAAPPTPKAAKRLIEDGAAGIQGTALSTPSSAAAAAEMFPDERQRQRLQARASKKRGTLRASVWIDMVHGIRSALKSASYLISSLFVYSFTLICMRHFSFLAVISASQIGISTVHL